MILDDLAFILLGLLTAISITTIISKTIIKADDDEDGENHFLRVMILTMVFFFSFAVWPLVLAITIVAVPIYYFTVPRKEPNEKQI